MIEFTDDSGMSIKIDSVSYKNSMLPDNLKDAWDDPDKLFSLIKISIDDGFFDEIEEAALHLLTIDPDKVRSHCAYCAILRNTNRTKEAEAFLLAYLKSFPSSSYILGNLAGIQYKLNKKKEALENAALAISLEPDQSYPSGVYIGFKTSLFEETGLNNDDAYFKALKEHEAQFNNLWSWVWLGGYYLKHSQKDLALDYFKKALAKNRSSDVLFSISGDLGNTGHAKELISNISPHYIPESHVAEIGYNLLQAHLKLGNIKEGKKLLVEMFDLKRPTLYRQLFIFKAEYRKLWWKKLFKFW